MCKRLLRGPSTFEVDVLFKRSQSIQLDQEAHLLKEKLEMSKLNIQNPPTGCYEIRQTLPNTLKHYYQYYFLFSIFLSKFFITFNL